MTARRFCVYTSLVVCLLAAGQVSLAQDKGQADLDQALSAKLTAGSFDELTEVVDLCQNALDRGLDEQNTRFAKQLLAGTLLERATLIHEAILKSPPDDVQALQQFVRLRQVALADLERSIRLDSEHPESHYLLGRLHALPGGDRKRAMKALDEAVRLKGEDETVHSKALMTRALLQEDPKKQLADCDAAVEADPNNVDALRTRGTVLLDQGKFAKGLIDIDAALKIDPEHASTHERRGIALASLEKLDEALKSFDRAIELSPDSPFSYVYRARVQLLREQPKAAIKDLNQVMAVRLPTPAMLLLRANAYLQLEDAELALADIDTALKLDPKHVGALRARAAILAGDGKFDQAIIDLKEVSKAEPKDPKMMVQLALLYSAAGQLRSAIETFSSALELEAENLLALQGRADTYIRLGKHAEAMADYDSVLKLEPENSHVLNNLAWLLATSPDKKLRDGRRAIELAKKGCEVTEYKQAHILSTLAAGYAETGDFKTAIEWSRKAVEHGEGEIKEHLAKELASYQDGKPWRERQEEPEEPHVPEKTATKPGEIK